MQEEKLCDRAETQKKNGGSRLPLFKKRDVVFTVVTILAIAILLLLPKAEKTEIFAAVRLNGEKIAELPLDSDGSFNYTCNEQTVITVVVKDKIVTLKGCECESLGCSSGEQIKNPGESLGCKTAGITVTIEGEKHHASDSDTKEK